MNWPTIARASERASDGTSAMGIYIPNDMFLLFNTYINRNFKLLYVFPLKLFRRKVDMN